MFERDAAAHRLVGYLEEAMKQIDNICDQPPSTKDALAGRLVAIKKIATMAIERAKI